MLCWCWCWCWAETERPTPSESDGPAGFCYRKHAPEGVVEPHLLLLIRNQSVALAPNCAAVRTHARNSSLPRPGGGLDHTRNGGSTRQDLSPSPSPSRSRTAIAIRRSVSSIRLDRMKIYTVLFL